MQLESNPVSHHENIDKEKLPELMKELIDLIGYANMYRLISSFGGQDVYIPKYPKRSKLSDELPLDALHTLSQEYGGTYLTLPTSRQIDIQGRNREIIHALHNGESRKTVAKRFRLGIRQIANIRKNLA
ncbi:transcriptional regulator [Veronia nyctiphanis]|uniref:Transcriptional regulator n=1 Tax=Veronia nyctiphanis TaxID=1278244 RepID=A0A4Q0YKG7_9GAMM|nr:Mor transcription activator family protein [Veronia nyctiphanis]RXJ71232.1 transcriptional regulator [Veronia nyctiphanis]